MQCIEAIEYIETYMANYLVCSSYHKNGIRPIFIYTTNKMIKLDFHPIDIEPFIRTWYCFFYVCLYCFFLYSSFFLNTKCLHSVLKSLYSLLFSICTHLRSLKLSEIKSKKLNFIIFNAISIIACSSYFLFFYLFHFIVCIHSHSIATIFLAEFSLAFLLYFFFS